MTDEQTGVVSGEGEQQLVAPAQDAGAQQAAPEAEPGEEQAADKAAPTPEPDIAPIRSRAQERIKGLIAQNKALRAELDTRGEPPEAEKPAEPQRDERGRFAAADEAEDEAFLTIDGEQIPRKFAERQVAIEERVAAQERRAQEQEQAAYEAEQQARWGRVYDASEETIVEMIGKQYPTLDSDTREAAERAAINAAAHHVIAETGGDRDKITEPLLMEAIDRGVADIGRLLRAGAARQAEDNARHAEEHRVTPGGTVGGPAPKSLDQMTRAEREAATRFARQQVDARRAAER